MQSRSPAGGHVHTHNIGPFQHIIEIQLRETSRAELEAQTGFKRPDVTVRNQCGLSHRRHISSNSEMAESAKYLPAALREHYRLPAPMAARRWAMTRRTRAGLAALCRHPNAGGVLLVGLGCRKQQHPHHGATKGIDPKRIRSWSVRTRKMNSHADSNLEELGAPSNAKRDSKNRWDWRRLKRPVRHH